MKIIIGFNNNFDFKILHEYYQNNETLDFFYELSLLKKRSLNEFIVNNIYFNSNLKKSLYYTDNGAKNVCNIDSINSNNSTSDDNLDLLELLVDKILHINIL